jgi:hypothetical protein
LIGGALALDPLMPEAESSAQMLGYVVERFCNDDWAGFGLSAFTDTAAGLSLGRSSARQEAAKNSISRRLFRIMGSTLRIEQTDNLKTSFLRK